jgi:uncharacterized repeat protein (TIGR03803 family)
MYPIAELLDYGGLLFGVTAEGGDYNVGTAFSIRRASGRETVVHAFPGGRSGVAGPDGDLLELGRLLYGTTSHGGPVDSYGAIYSLNPATGAVRLIYSFKFTGEDGSPPNSGLTSVGGLLYGTTINGGSSQAGTIFAIDPATGLETFFLPFNGGGDGARPWSGMTNVDGILYGTTHEGGDSNAGTLFSFDPATGTRKLLYSFSDGPGGAGPNGKLVVIGRRLYGVTDGGGAFSNGVVYSFNLNRGTESVLHSFNYMVDGASPRGGLTRAGNMLYGATLFGGDFAAGSCHDCGTVFATDTRTGVTTMLHGFTGGYDGAVPYGPPIKVGGTLYGTTSSGGRVTRGWPLGCGTVYSLSPVTGVEAVLHAFRCSMPH